MSTFVDPYTRLSLIAGTAVNNFQIPNVNGAALNAAVTPPVFGVSTFNSAMLNENQFEQTEYGVLALQRSVNGFDGQLSYFTRYNQLHFMPDPVGDLLLNGISSDVSRQSYSNGIRTDASYVINAAHTVSRRFLIRGAEQAWVDNTLIVQPCTMAHRRITPRYGDHRHRRLKNTPGSPASMPKTSGSSPTS